MIIHPIYNISPQPAGIASGPPLAEGSEEDERTAEEEDAAAAAEEPQMLRP